MDFVAHLREYGFFLANVGSKQFYTMPEITRFDALLLCDTGYAEIEVNMDRIFLKPRSCMVCNHVVYGKTLSVSADFSATVLLVDSAFSLDATVGVPTQSSSVIQAKRVLYIDDDRDWALLNAVIDVVRLYSDRKISAHSREMMGLQLRSLVMLLSEINKMPQNLAQNTDFTTGDIYFRNFIKLIDTYIKEHHEVAFYAKQLNISPKYLSELCKNKAGYKAKEVISTVLVANLKRDLLMSGKSMKVIAHEYGFADQSSLGKFFRKMTGKSPISYRKDRQ